MRRYIKLAILGITIILLILLQPSIMININVPIDIFNSKIIDSQQAGPDRLLLIIKSPSNVTIIGILFPKQD